MHELDANETHQKETRREVHKNAMCFFKQNLEAVPHKTTSLQSLTSHIQVR